MALFNESLEGRFQRLIQQLHGMKGGSPAPQVAPEIMHVIQLEGERPEYHYLYGSTRYSSGWFTLAAAVGFFSTFDIANPAGSGVLGVIEQFWLKAVAAAYDADVRVFAAAVAAGTTGNGVPLDLREKSSKKSALLITANNTSVGGKSGSQLAKLSIEPNVAPGADVDTPIEEVVGLVLAPGTHLTVFTDVANTAAALRSIVWRERAASPAELLPA